MNKDLLLKIANEIKKAPLKFQMGWWVHASVSEMEESLSGEIIHSTVNQVWNICSTTGCIAGWACALSDKVIYRRDVDWEGQRLLDLNHLEAKRLFYISGWPKQFYSGYYSSSPEKQAELANQRIIHFINTDGEE